MKIQAAFLALVLCLAPSFSQTRGPQRRPAAKPPRAPFLDQVKSYDESAHVSRIVLKNGMTVLVNEFGAQPAVAVQLYVRAGAADDPPEQPGMSRLAAAMALRGGPAGAGSSSFNQKLHAFGGTARRETGYDTTVFEIDAPADQWKRALNVMAETVLNPALDPGVLKQEAALVRGEARGALSDPSVSAREQLLDLAFNDPALRPNGAAAGASGSYSAEGLAAFYKSFYTPERMLLVISGEVRSAEVLNEAARILMKAAAPAKAQPPAARPEPRPPEFGYRVMRGPVAAPRVFFGFRAVPENHADYRALQVLASALGLGEGSFLTSRLRDAKKLIYSSEAVLSSYPGFGWFTIEVRTAPANIDAAELAVLTEVERLKRVELSDVDLARAVAQLERAYWAGLETVGARGRALAHFEMLSGWKLMDGSVGQLRKVTAADVKRVAAKYLRLENCSLLEYLPESAEERKLNPEGLRSTFESLLEPSVEEELAKEEKETRLAIKIPPAPPAFKSSEIRHQFQTASVLRGPELFIREDHTSPLIDLGIFFPGGKLGETGENAGITMLMTRLMLRGGEDVRHFYRQFEVYGATVRPVVADDFFGFHVSAPSRNFEEAFLMLLETIRAPNFTEEEVERQKEVQRIDLLERSYARAHAGDLARRALFGGFPYARESCGTAEGIAAATPEAVQSWYDQLVKNRRPIVAIVGDTSGTSLATIFVKRFSGSRFQTTKLPEGFVKPLEKGQTVEESWRGGESLVVFGFQAPPLDDEDAQTAAVFERYAGGPGLLAQELRDRLGVAHRVSVEYDGRLRGGSLLIQAAAGPDGAEPAVKAMTEALEKMRSNPIPSRDFRSGVNAAVGRYAVRHQSRSVQIEEVAQHVLAGTGIEGYRAWPQSLRTVTEEEMRTLIRRVLNLENAVIVKMGGGSQAFR